MGKQTVKEVEINPNRLDISNQEIKSSLEVSKSLVDEITVSVIGFLGSIPFLISCVILFALWICWNLNFFHILKPFDPFPFPILEMLVSLFAIILSVSVLINQNRQGKIEKVRQQVEFEVNVRAENEITKVLQMLHEIQDRMGIKRTGDKELEEMKEQINIQQLHQKLDEKEAGKE
jgi:uncharacterized membrane protein